MKPSQLLLQARRRAGLTQRELARRTDVPQSTVARIETEAIDPRATTLDALLRECGDDLDSRPRLGIGVDRSLIREHLKLSPRERLDVLEEAASFFTSIRGKARPRRDG